MTEKDKLFWVEVEVETLLARAEQARQDIIENIPHTEIYTITGEVNMSTRWGAVLWTINQSIASLQAMGF